MLGIYPRMNSSSLVQNVTAWWRLFWTGAKLLRPALWQSSSMIMNRFPPPADEQF